MVELTSMGSSISSDMFDRMLWVRAPIIFCLQHIKIDTIWGVIKVGERDAA